jgi:biopolymer transport protein ExbB
VLLALFIAASPAAAQAPAPAPDATTSTAAPAAPMAATTAAPAASAKKNGDAIDNPYGLEALWKGSDAIARFVLILLAIMSIGSWYIMITKLIEQGKMKRHARTVDKSFWAAGTVSAGAGSLEKNSAYRFIAESGVAATNDHGQ